MKRIGMNRRSLGAFLKVAKSNYWLLHVRLSVRVLQLGSHWMDLHAIWYWSIFVKYIKKISIFIKICQE
jgi:hypothetical protein